MGLLSLGTPLPWDECKEYADHVRHHGITQLLHIWDRLKSRSGDKLLWGDEVYRDRLLRSDFDADPVTRIDRVHGCVFRRPKPRRKALSEAVRNLTKALCRVQGPGRQLPGRIVSVLTNVLTNATTRPTDV